MKNIWSKLIAIVFFGIVSQAGFCFDYPGDDSIGEATIPQAESSGLVRKPQINYSAIGDIVVSGSLPDGKYFRGIIPYNSTSELSILQGTLGSSLLNSDSLNAGGGFYPDSSSPFQPQFSPLPTTTSLQRSQVSSLLMPQQVQFAGETGSSKLQTASNLNAAFKGYYTQSRPLTAELSELETALAQQRELRKFQQDMERILKEESLFNNEETLAIEPRELSNDLQDKKLLQHFQPPKPLEPDKPKTIEDVPTEYEDIHEQMQKELDKEAEKLLGETPEEEETIEVKPPLTDAEAADKGPFGKWMKIGRAEHEKAKKILGSHKTYKSFASAKYAEYTLQAKMYLREGRYYKAADMYTLAAIYDRENGQILAKKAISLFAAGEYMSASFFLSKALLLSPEQVARKIDLVAFISNRDVIDDRLVEMDKFLQKSGSGELAFLMAYVYRNMDNASKAKGYINQAAAAMPESQAVKALKKIIDPAKDDTK